MENKDLLKEAMIRHRKIRQEKIIKQLTGKGNKKHIFTWTKNIVKCLIDGRKPLKIEKIRDYLKKNYPDEYEGLPDEVIEERIYSILIGLQRKGSIKNLKQVNLKFVYQHDAKVIRYGKTWELEIVKYNKEKKFKELLKKLSSKNNF